MPEIVIANEEQWEETHHNTTGDFERQVGDNLDPPANTCLLLKVIYNNGWVNHFDNQADAAAGAETVVREAERIYQDKFSSSNRLNSHITFTVSGGGKQLQF